MEIENTLPTREAAHQASKSAEDDNRIIKLHYEYQCIRGSQINNLHLNLQTTPIPLWLHREANSAPPCRHYRFLGWRNLGLLKNQVESVVNLPETSASVPVCYNHSVLLPRSKQTFHTWREKGPISIKTCAWTDNFRHLTH